MGGGGVEAGGGGLIRVGGGGGGGGERDEGRSYRAAGEENGAGMNEGKGLGE